MIPLKLAMAREIARKLVENPNLSVYKGVAKTFLENAEFWETQGDWETGSACWMYIADHMPEILEKLCTENVQESE